MARRWIAVSLFLPIAVAALAWADDAAAFQVRDGKKILIFGARQAVPNLDPHVRTDWSTRTIQQSVYDALLKYEGNPPKLVPWLAESYAVSKDGMTYTFKLDKRAKFHSGDPVTAYDVSAPSSPVPIPQTFNLRDGALTYAPFDLTRMPDGQVYDGSALKSPIDEFNAPVGAALCEKEDAMFPAAAIPGTGGIATYGACLRLDTAGEILGEIFQINFGVTENHTVCEMTRTTLSALRIGDYVHRHDARRADRDARGLHPRALAARRRQDDPPRLLAGARRIPARARGLAARRLRWTEELCAQPRRRLALHRYAQCQG